LSEDPDKKKKLWLVDPSIYQKGPQARFFRRRIVPPLWQLGKFALIGLALTYPIYLVYIGLAFGGIAFWAFLAGSFAIIGVIISRLGFSRNFRNWDIGFRRMGAVFLGFLAAFGFYEALINLKTIDAAANAFLFETRIPGVAYLQAWLVLAILLFIVGLYLSIRRSRSLRSIAINAHFYTEASEPRK
jgi:hypothetical protein